MGSKGQLYLYEPIVSGQFVSSRINNGSFVSIFFQIRFEINNIREKHIRVRDGLFTVEYFVDVLYLRHNFL